MTGWGLNQETTLRMPAQGTTGAAPSAETLADATKAAQREQLATLIDALAEHPDLAARLYKVIRPWV